MDAKNSEEVRSPKWFIEENNNFTWQQALDKAFPKSLLVRNLKNPKPWCMRSCKFPDGVRTGRYKYHRCIVMHDGEEVDIYELEKMEWKMK